jgi:hypothetical protein
MHRQMRDPDADGYVAVLSRPSPPRGTEGRELELAGAVFGLRLAPARVGGFCRCVASVYRHVAAAVVVSYRGVHALVGHAPVGRGAEAAGGSMWCSLSQHRLNVDTAALA